MSVVPQIKSDWIRQNYEKVILLGVLIVLLASALNLVLRIEKARQLISDSGRAVVQTPGQDTKAMDLQSLSLAQSKLSAPLQIAPPSNRLFSSELRVSCVVCSKPIPYQATVCTFCGSPQPDSGALRQQDTDSDGIPDEWEIAKGMDPVNPDDANHDLDGDGFSALDEMRWKTNPLSREDHPPFVARLRFERVVTEPFRFRFVAVQEIQPGVLVFQLNVRTMDQTYFKRVNETVEGYTISEYRKEEDTLTLTRGDRTVSLKRGKEVIDEQITVRFAFLIDRSRMEVRLGQTFKLRDVEYRMEKEIPKSTARIVRIDTGEAFVIESLTDSEKRLMDGGSSPTSFNAAPAADSLLLETKSNAGKKTER